MHALSWSVCEQQTAHLALLHVVLRGAQRLGLLVPVAWYFACSAAAFVCSNSQHEKVVPT